MTQPEDMMELHIGSSAYEIVMNNLREQGCTCEPSEIKVAALRKNGLPWTGENDPELLGELREGFLRPAIVDHDDDCALSALIDPLDRRATANQAGGLLLESVPALACGVTVLTKPDRDDEPHLDRQMAGYVEVAGASEFGQEILSRWVIDTQREVEDHMERDNWSRWTMIDHGPKAKIILEIVEADPAAVVEKEADLDFVDENPGTRGVICFEYPVDRDCLMVAGATGYLLVRAGEAPKSDRHAHPEGRGLTYASGKATGENTTLITLSTGDQVLKMIEILDARNPNLRKNSVHDIMRQLDIAQVHDEDGIELGKTDIEDAKELLLRSDRPLAAATSVFNSMAVRMAVIRADRVMTTKEVADAVDLKEALVERILHGSFQEDNAWVMGHQLSTGDWEWARHPSITGDMPTPSHFEGHNLFTSEGRMQSARALLQSMGVEIPLEEISPAMAMFKSMVDFGRFEGAFMELLRKNPPIWASAKGFAKFMEQVRWRAGLAKQLGINRTDQLTYLHLHLGHSMHIAHVLVMDSAQVAVLPKFSSEAEQFDFACETPLAFDPLFIDFTGDADLPGFDSDIAFEGEQVKLLGAVINSDPDPNVLFITPIFYYGNPTAPVMAVALGTMAINRSGVPAYQFSYVLGSKVRFEQPAMTLIAHTDILENEPDIAAEYKRLIELASERVLGALYLLEAANVEMVPRELPRREKKRQEKRGWKIPLVVRVDRPSRRTYEHSANGNGQPRDYSHQFEVIGHYNHVKRGPMASCTVCEGRKTKDLVCPHCNDTGLDPEKVKPCTRIDVTTGEKTCPDGCRKIWISPYWKGDPTKPMVVKTRKIR